MAFVSQGEGQRTLFASNTPHKRSDSSAIFEGLQAAMAACGHPDALCVGLGPGSYNGLRAGIVAARALATALDIPLFALASPLAFPSPDPSFWAVGDARGGHYWIARIAEGVFLQAPMLLPPPDTVALLATRPELSVLGSTPLPEIDRLIIATPDAGRLAMLTKKVDPCVGTPEPLYLKPPHITAPRLITA